MRTRKRVFLGLVLFTILIFLAVAFNIWVLAFEPESAFSQALFIGITLMLSVFICLTAAGLGLLILTLVKGYNYPRFRWLINRTVVLVYPVVLQLGRLFKIAQDKIQRSFIEVNNQLTEIRGIRVKPQQLLVLLPHCLQKDDCPHKITRNPWNCRRCGRCSIASALELSRKYGFNLQVVTGGTLAREAVLYYKPRAVVAVACERDLSSGIMDSLPLPVIGILNERPEGPCHNTCVNISSLEKAIQKFLGKPG